MLYKTMRAKAVLLAQEAADLANSKEVVWARIGLSFLLVFAMLVGAETGEGPSQVDGALQARFDVSIVVEVHSAE